MRQNIVCPWFRLGLAVNIIEGSECTFKGDWRKYRPAAEQDVLTPHRDL